MKSTLGKITDMIFAFLAAFVVSYIWARYFASNFISILAATVIGICVCALVRGYAFTKEADSLSKRDLWDMQAHINQLIFCQNEQCLEFFKSLFARKNGSASICKDYVLTQDENGENILIAPKIKLGKISGDDLSEAMRDAIMLKYNRVIVLTSVGASAEALALTELLPSLRVDIYDSKQIFKLMRTHSIFPPATVEITQKKFNTRQILSTAINKKNTRGYLVAALMLGLYSYFIPYSFFYLAIASLCVYLAIMCKISKKA